MPNNGQDLAQKSKLYNDNYSNKYLTTKQTELMVK